MHGKVESSRDCRTRNTIMLGFTNPINKPLNRRLFNICFNSIILFCLIYLHVLKNYGGYFIYNSRNSLTMKSTFISGLWNKVRKTNTEDCDHKLWRTCLAINVVLFMSLTFYFTAKVYLKTLRFFGLNFQWLLSLW